MKPWNSMSREVADCPVLETYKVRLDRAFKKAGLDEDAPGYCGGVELDYF